jgi:MazG family protein
MANPNQQITRSPAQAPSAAARAAGDELARLVDIMATLRGPDGCPWDREQTIDTLKPFVLEETYEVLEAIDQADHGALREELGDFLFEAVFLAQLESEAGHFAIADSVKAVSDKLVRRHPHVFARETLDAPVDTAGKVKVRWEEIKAEERGADAAPKTLLGGVPAALPALLRAYQIGSRAASVNFDWIGAQDVVDKIEEEVDEIREVARDGDEADRSRIEEEVGDLLFAIANLARKLGVEPETALRKANDKFTRRFTAMAKRIEASGRRMREMSLEELEAEWQKVKETHSDQARPQKA